MRGEGGGRGGRGGRGGKDLNEEGDGGAVEGQRIHELLLPLGRRQPQVALGGHEDLGEAVFHGALRSQGLDRALLRGRRQPGRGILEGARGAVVGDEDGHLLEGREGGEGEDVAHGGSERDLHADPDDGDGLRGGVLGGDDGDEEGAPDDQGKASEVQDARVKFDLPWLRVAEGPSELSPVGQRDLPLEQHGIYVLHPHPLEEIQGRRGAGDVEDEVEEGEVAEEHVAAGHDGISPPDLNGGGDPVPALEEVEDEDEGKVVREPGLPHAHEEEGEEEDEGDELNDGLDADGPPQVEDAVEDDEDELEEGKENPAQRLPLAVRAGAGQDETDEEGEEREKLWRDCEHVQVDPDASPSQRVVREPDHGRSPLRACPERGLASGGFLEQETGAAAWRRGHRAPPARPWDPPAAH
eukprot:756582-Hanusia_phi.AAC.4